MYVTGVTYVTEYSPPLRGVECALIYDAQVSFPRLAGYCSLARARSGPVVPGDHHQRVSHCPDDRPLLLCCRESFSAQAHVGLSVGRQVSPGYGSAAHRTLVESSKPLTATYGAEYRRVHLQGRGGPNVFSSNTGGSDKSNPCGRQRLARHKNAPQPVAGTRRR